MKSAKTNTFWHRKQNLPHRRIFRLQHFQNDFVFTIAFVILMRNCRVQVGVEFLAQCLDFLHAHAVQDFPELHQSHFHALEESIVRIDLSFLYRNGTFQIVDNCQKLFNGTSYAVIIHHGFFFYCTLAEVIKFRQCSLIFVQIIRSLLFQLRDFFCRFIHSIRNLFRLNCLSFRSFCCFCRRLLFLQSFVFFHFFHVVPSFLSIFMVPIG